MKIGDLVYGERHDYPMIIIGYSTEDLAICRYMVDSKLICEFHPLNKLRKN